MDRKITDKIVERICSGICEFSEVSTHLLNVRIYEFDKMHKIYINRNKIIVYCQLSLGVIKTERSYSLSDPDCIAKARDFVDEIVVYSTMG